MGDYHCEICDKPTKSNYKKKHLITKSHTALSMFLITRCCVKKPELIEIDKKLENHVNNYIKSFDLYFVTCNWKLQFVDTTIHVESKKNV